VKQLILQDYRLPEGFSGELYGKTGTCMGQDVNQGWDARTLAIEVLQDIR
jgi:hypothetical protein